MICGRQDHDASAVRWLCEGHKAALFAEFLRAVTEDHLRHHQRDAIIKTSRPLRKIGQPAGRFPTRTTTTNHKHDRRVLLYPFALILLAFSFRRAEETEDRLFSRENVAFCSQAFIQLPWFSTLCYSSSDLASGHVKS
jgi:hypothetical protein